MEKLTHDAQTVAATILRTGLKKWKQTILELKIVPKTIKMLLIRPPMTNLKMTVRADCAVSACNTVLCL